MPVKAYPVQLPPETHEKLRQHLDAAAGEGTYVLKLSRLATTEEKILLNHCITHQTSFLAARCCEEELPLQVLRSGAGYYLGSIAGPEDDLPGEPVSRDSVEYWGDEGEAQAALDAKTWTQRLDP